MAATLIENTSANTATKATSDGRLAFMVRALRGRNYRLFFIGQLISLLGTWMTQIATTWLVYKLTNSPFLLGAVAFAGQVPAFLLAPMAGVWVDRLNKHRLLVVTQILAMVQSFMLALLAFSEHMDKTHMLASLLALMAFQGLINAFDMPGRQAFVVEMVEDKSDLPNAIALNSSMFNMARLVGPTVGGLLIVAVGEGWCFLLDGFSYFAVIAGLLMMKIVADTKPKAAKRPLQEMKEGYRYSFGFAPIRVLLILMAAMSLIGMPYGVLLPVVAKEILHGGPNTLGFLTAASGSGALVGALMLAARKSVRGLTKIIPLCTLGFGFGLGLFSQATVIWVALPLLFAMGYCMMQQNAACNTLLQTIVDSDKRGRVMSLYTMAFMGMAPFGSLWAGALAQRFGVGPTLLVAATGSILTGIWLGWRMPQLREDIRPIYQRLGIIPESATDLEVAAGLEEVSELSKATARAS